ncbi:MAG: sigma-70 family RNA polymerase sigma factor [Bacteroidales bacterium]|nr:sigma-70 family RNA polymerase sigma factor [Bacteroidales bacterium]
MTPTEREQEFRQMVEKHKDMLWHICTDYTLNAAWERDDCFQEILISLWQSFDSLRNSDCERRYVYQVATNTMLMLRRKKSNLPNLPMIQENEADAVSDFNLHEDYRYFMELVEQLGDTNSLIVRRTLDGYTFQETAVVMDMTTTAVSHRYSRAIKKIKQQYENSV